MESAIRNPSLSAQNTPEGKKYLDRIRALKPYQRLLHWIVERHLVHCRRFPEVYHQTDPGIHDANFHLKETPPPWTEDPILQTIFFCNPYREHDKVTAYFRDNFRHKHQNDPCVFLGSILLRWFNYIPTARLLIQENVPQRLFGEQKLHALDDAFNLLNEVRSKGGQLFGGAYIIKLFNGVGKLEAVIEVMKTLARDSSLYPAVNNSPMSQAARRLRTFSGMGNFYIYQFIGDLAYTHVFPEKRTPDWHTWSFSGPGTSRSIHRLQGRDRQPDGSVWERGLSIPPGATAYLDALRVRVNEDLVKINKKLPDKHKLFPIHARDLTGCLCEYDKYCRALNNERTLKRGYNGQ